MKAASRHASSRPLGVSRALARARVFRRPRSATEYGSRIASAAGDARGQASIELLGLLPLVAVIALVAMTVVASHAAGEQAGEAAEAGALALLQGGGESPRDAAEHALDEPTRRRATITITGHTVHVRVRPRVALPIPGLAEALAGQAEADAGQ